MMPSSCQYRVVSCIVATMQIDSTHSNVNIAPALTALVLR